MTTKKQRITFDEHGAPKVVITIEGWADALRFAWAMRHLPHDFAAVGSSVQKSLKRKLGARRYSELCLHFTGRPAYDQDRAGGNA